MTQSVEGNVRKLLRGLLARIVVISGILEGCIIKHCAPCVVHSVLLRKNYRELSKMCNLLMGSEFVIYNFSSRSFA